MSLGFAEVVNPGGGGSTPVLSQFYMVLVTLLFLALNGHLRLIQLLADSFQTLPPGPLAIDAQGLHAVVMFATHLFAGAVRVALPAVTALAVGLLIGVIQAATQINEMTLSFIPKLIAMAVVALVTGPWMLRTLVQFTRQLIEGLPGAVK
jgi:flagellar biosynthetic protein FliR